MSQNGIFCLTALQHETVWLDANKYSEAERQFHELEAQQSKKEFSKTAGDEGKQGNEAKPISSLACQIANAREKIKNFLQNESKVVETDVTANILKRISDLEKDNVVMRQKLAETFMKMDKALLKFQKLEDALKAANVPVDLEEKEVILKNGPADDDLDLFGSDEETEDEAKLKMERLKAYQEKKSKKPALVAKSSVVLDVKPWSDETDMKELETAVRKIELDGLKWGAAKLVPLAFGIHKLQIIAIVEDDKVSIDWLQESIQDIEDLVQSVDIAAFNKL